MLAAEETRQVASPAGAARLARSSISAVFCTRVLTLPWLKSTTGKRPSRAGAPITACVGTLGKWLAIHPKRGPTNDSQRERARSLSM